MNTIRIAFKNLMRQKKRTIMLGGAIAIGIMVIILINSATTGLVASAKENFSHFFAGHVYINAVEKTGSGRVIRILRNDAFLKESLEESDINYSGLSTRSSFSGKLIFGKKGISQMVIGIDFSKEVSFKDHLILTQGKLDNLDNPNALILSGKMAEKLNVEVGDTILAKMTTVTGQQNVGEFILAVITADSGFLGSMSAYAHLKYVNYLLNLAPGEYQTMNIFLEDLDTLEEDADRLYKTLSTRADMFPRTRPGDHVMKSMREDTISMEVEGRKYQLLTINDMMAELQQLIKIIDYIGLGVLFILLLIIMVGITNTFRMVVQERTQEIGTMRAVGMQRSGVRNIFLLEALFLAVGGALAGLITALIITFFASLYSFDIDSIFYMFTNKGRFNFKIEPVSVVINMTIVGVLSLIAALFPANKAAKLKPADALRKEY
ncbi:ABC transporter permease [bacterium]|nr:ABC transporter permease [bacterium]